MRGSCANQDPRGSSEQTEVRNRHPKKIMEHILQLREVEGLGRVGVREMLDHDADADEVGKVSSEIWLQELWPSLQSNR